MTLGCAGNAAWTRRPITVEREQEWARRWAAEEDRCCPVCADAGCAACDSDEAA